MFLKDLSSEILTISFHVFVQGETDHYFPVSVRARHSFLPVKEAEGSTLNPEAQCSWSDPGEPFKLLWFSLLERQRGT